ncbi:hypothetical protein [Brevundimonas sp.]|nr:hypothetical protein [Brevundimonas sp.]MDZ4363254.1 hypothetical protein [Brevundimonas sp.]
MTRSSPQGVVQADTRQTWTAPVIDIACVGGAENGTTGAVSDGETLDIS